MDRGRATVSGFLDVLSWGEGEAMSSRDLRPMIYAELRRLAARRLGRAAPGETLQPTSLVHEAYLRLVNGGEERFWENRGNFYAAAAEAMRRILIDRAREKGRLKRGGGRRRHFLNLDELFDEGTPPDDLIDLDEALIRLAQVYPDSAALVKLRVFAGLTLGQAARALGIARRTADRDWALARAWLFEQLGGDEERDVDGITDRSTTPGFPQRPTYPQTNRASRYSRGRFPADRSTAMSSVELYISHSITSVQ
jgi:RNA polymerase sigma factor (TIGR02999 family)